MGTCHRTGKVRYRDRIAAQLALAKLRWQGKPGHGERREYPCAFCRGFHLTSEEKRPAASE